MAGSAERGGVQGLRRLGLRHLRRLLLPRQEASSWSAAAIRRWRRRSISRISPPPSRSSIAATRSAPSASCIERLLARPNVDGPLEPRGRGDHRRRDAERRRRSVRPARRRAPARSRSSRPTACSSPSAMRPQTELVRGQVELEAQRLCEDRAGFDRDQHRGRVRGRRRRRRRLSAGRHRRRARLHGGAGGRSLAAPPRVLLSGAR